MKLSKAGNTTTGTKASIGVLKLVRHLDTGR